jgi:ABC-type transport system involved in multi-copper enzyme maturation permease subunit
MKSNQFKTIFQKDTLVVVRSYWYFLPLAIVQVLVMQFTTMNQVLHIEGQPMPREMEIMILNGLMGYIPLIVIPFLSSTVLHQIILEERNKQTLLPILCTGVNPRLIWWGKIGVTFSLSYAVNLLCQIAFLILAWVYTGYLMPLSPALAFGFLIVTPAIAGTIVAILSLMFWYYKKPGLVVMLFPMLIFMGSWMLAARDPLTTVFPPVKALAILALVSAVFILCGFTIGQVSKERVAGLY